MNLQEIVDYCRRLIDEIEKLEAAIDAEFEWDSKTAKEHRKNARARRLHELHELILKQKEDSRQ